MVVKLGDRAKRHAVVRVNQRQVFDKKQGNNVGPVRFEDWNSGETGRYYLLHSLWDIKVVFYSSHVNESTYTCRTQLRERELKSDCLERSGNNIIARIS